MFSLAALTAGDVANSTLLYILVATGLAYVAVLCVISYRKGKKRAQELGIANETLSAINKNALTVSIVPSLSIVIGLFSLAAAIGTPWAWFRLSVVGSVTYELIAAQMATAALGFSEMPAAMHADASVFGAIMFVMSIGIIAGNVVNILFGKTIITGFKKAGQKVGVGTVINGSFMMALMGVMIPSQMFSANGFEPVKTLVTLSAIAISMAMAFIAKKTGAKWLNEFNLAFTLILGMACSLLWLAIL